MSTAIRLNFLKPCKVLSTFRPKPEHEKPGGITKYNNVTERDLKLEQAYSLCEN